MSDRPDKASIRIEKFYAEYISLEVDDLDSVENKEDRFNIEIHEDLVEGETNRFQKVFECTFSKKVNDQQILTVDVDYCCIFRKEGSPIDEVFMEGSFATIASSAIGYPFLRAMISTLTLQAGFDPVIIPSINFVKYYNRDKDNNSGN